ncbi:MAG: DUF2325 domain-containing protein [Anaerotignum sp.]
MSIAIVGGNDCMVHRYKQLCEEYGCKAKVFTQPQGIKSKIGTPDLLVLFTNTVSHRMVQSALSSVSDDTAVIVRSHSSSLSALKKILSNHAM